MRSILLVVTLLAGCYSPKDAFVCASADQCQAGGQFGTCEPNGWCSYADGSCDSGRRYSEAAGGGVSGLCVGDEPGADPIPDAQPGLPDAILITGCTDHDDCAPITDACGTGACDTASGVCQKIPEIDGTSCGSPMCGGFGECGSFDSTCDTSGSQSRSCQPMVCSSGACVIGGAYSDSQGCSRGTDGASCGGTVCTDYGACQYATECIETGTRYRTCYPQVCGGGSCGNGAGTQEADPNGAACNRVTGAPVFKECYSCTPPGVCEGGNCLCT